MFFLHLCRSIRWRFYYRKEPGGVWSHFFGSTCPAFHLHLTVMWYVLNALPCFHHQLMWWVCFHLLLTRCWSWVGMGCGENSVSELWEYLGHRSHITYCISHWSWNWKHTWKVDKIMHNLKICKNDFCSFVVVSEMDLIKWNLLSFISNTWPQSAQHKHHHDIYRILKRRIMKIESIVWTHEEERPRRICNTCLYTFLSAAVDRQEQ